MMRLALVGMSVLLAACDMLSPGDGAKRPAAAQPFPKADRPVAPIVSTRWSSEEARDRVHEADDIMDRAGIRPGMTVADIGAGEGYYTVRLAARVGAEGRVLAEGAPEDPRLPENSFDRIMMVHMYHEIAEPYAFLWHLSPALKKNGELIVVDADRPTDQHGTPPRLLACELAAMGFRMEELIPKPTAGGYFARFRRIAARPDPARIIPCALNDQ